MKNGRWLAVFLLLLGVFAVLARAEPSAESLDELLKAGRYREAYDRAVKAGGAAVTTLARSLLEQSLASPDSYQRWYALRASRTVHDEGLVPTLRKIAREGDRYEQSLALDALIATAPKAARDELVQALGSPFRAVRLRALRGLSEIADPTLVPKFRNELLTDTDPDLRALAARALGETGSSDAVGPLQRAMSDSSEVVQEEATKALCKLGDTTLVQTLRQRLQREPEIEKKVRVIRLMGFVADPRMLETLGALLADGDAEVRAYTAASIVRISDELQAKP
jgi:HEAT repeats